PDRQQRRVVLRLRQVGLLQPPQFACAHPRREAPRQLRAVDQPFGLRVAPDDGGGKQHGASWLRSANLAQPQAARNPGYCPGRREAAAPPPMPRSAPAVQKSGSMPTAAPKPPKANGSTVCPRLVMAA